MDGGDKAAVRSVGHQKDELVIADIGSARNDIMNQSNVGFVVQGDGSRHTHVHIGMAAVHGAGQDRGAGTFGHFLGKIDCVEAVQAVGTMGAVLLDGAQGENRNVVDFLGIGEVHRRGVFLEADGIPLVQLEFGLLFQFSHDRSFLSLFRFQIELLIYGQTLRAGLTFKASAGF